MGEPRTRAPGVDAEVQEHHDRLLRAALRPGVIRVHVDPDGPGLRLRARRHDQGLCELGPVPARCAAPLVRALRRGESLPAGFRREGSPRGEPGPEAHRLVAADGRALSVVVTPGVAGDAFCLAAEGGPPVRPVEAAAGPFASEARRRRVRQALAPAGGLVLAFAEGCWLAAAGARELLAEAPEGPSVAYQVGPLRHPAVPGLTRLAPSLPGRTWDYASQVHWARASQPDLLLADPGATFPALDQLASAALEGTRVVAGAAVREAGLELALWARPGAVRERLHAALRGVLHRARLPRLCQACRRPRGRDRGPVPELRAGLRGYHRRGCAACAGTGVAGDVELIAWTPADAGLLGALGGAGSLEERTRRLRQVMAPSRGTLRDQVGVALRRGWTDPEGAQRVLAGLDLAEDVAA